MKEKINELILHHQHSCQELNELLNELYGLKNKTDNPEDINALESTIERYACETAWRKVFIGQLEDLL